MCRFNSKFGGGGVSFHVGAGCTDVKAFDIGRENGYALDLLDLGGGFPGTETATGLSFAAFAEQINTSLAKHC